HLFSPTTPTPTLYTLSLHDALPICETTRTSSPGRISGSASRTKPANTFFPSRWNGTESGSTITRRRGDGNAARRRRAPAALRVRSEEHTSELQSRGHLVCRLLLEKK